MLGCRNQNGLHQEIRHPSGRDTHVKRVARRLCAHTRCNAGHPTQQGRTHSFKHDEYSTDRLSKTPPLPKGLKFCTGFPTWTSQSRVPHLEWKIPHNTHDPGRNIQILSSNSECASNGGGHRGCVVERSSSNVCEATVLLQQRCSGLLTNPGDPAESVRNIAAHDGKVRVLGGSPPVLFTDV